MRKNFYNHLHVSGLVRLLFVLSIINLAPQYAYSQSSHAPFLLHQTNSTRAIALNSVTFQREPFQLNTNNPFSLDQRTRVVLFAINLTGADPGSLTVEAQDESGRRYLFPVEFVGPVPGFDWLHQVVVRLSDGLGNIGDVLVQLTYNNAASNRVRAAIGYVGGGPPNDNLSISGRITKTDATGLGGIVVAISGTQNTTTVTDATGYYAFLNLTPGANYTVTPSSLHYVISPQSQSFVTLVGNQSQDFAASLANYTISGRITNIDKVGISDITVMLSGSQSATTLSDANGYYSFDVSAGGDYTIRPFSLYHTLEPFSHTIHNLSSNQTLNFTEADLFYVLEFDGSPQTVEFTDFYGTGDLGHFFWEFWAMPGEDAGARYLLSDGYGGAHAVLFGMGYASPENRYTLYGNIWNGTESTTFGGDDGPAPYEWGHMAVGWDGTKIITYYNGVPVGRVPFLGPRRSMIGGGGGTLFIGGSDHQNWIGRIAQVRGYEGHFPFADFSGNGQSTSVFYPETVFGNTGDFLVSFLRPSQNIVDILGKRVGRLRGVGFGANDPRQTFPSPQFVRDLNAPTASLLTGPVPPTVQVDHPTLPPTGARVFDSFSRQNATYAFDGNGGLGSTEGGTSGPQVWQVPVDNFGKRVFGILNGRAVILGNSSYAAWINTGSSSANLDIRVDRRPGEWGSGNTTGLVFRFQDSANFFCAYTTGDTASNQQLTVEYFTSGNTTILTAATPMPFSWKTMRVITRESGSIEVYADATLVYSTNSTLLATVKNAGLWNSLYGRGLSNRWDNFTIFDAP